MVDFVGKLLARYWRCVQDFLPRTLSASMHVTRRNDTTRLRTLSIGRSLYLNVIHCALCWPMQHGSARRPYYQCHMAAAPQSLVRAEGETCPYYTSISSDDKHRLLVTTGCRFYQAPRSPMIGRRCRLGSLLHILWLNEHCFWANSCTTSIM